MYYLNVSLESKNTPRYLTRGLGDISMSPSFSPSFIVVRLLQKCISSILLISKLIVASLALEVSSSAISFSFLQLDLAEFKVTVIAKSSIQLRKQAPSLSRLQILRRYSRNKIGGIGEPCSIPISNSTFSYICLLKKSCSFLLLRKVATYWVNAIGSPSSLQIDRSQFAETWLNAPFISRNSVVAILCLAFFLLFLDWILFRSSRTASIADRYLLPPSCKSQSKLVVLARYPNLVVKIFSRIFPRQFNKEIGLQDFSRKQSFLFALGRITP